MRWHAGYAAGKTQPARQRIVAPDRERPAASHLSNALTCFEGLLDRHYRGFRRRRARPHGECHGLVFHPSRVPLGIPLGPAARPARTCAGGLSIAATNVPFAPKVRGSVTPGVMLADFHSGGRIARCVATSRRVARTLTIGIGAPAGSEGPAKSGSRATVGALWLMKFRSAPS